MIVIKNIDYIEVKESTATISHLPPMQSIYCTESGIDSCISAMEIQEEIVKGTRINAPNGNELVLGISKQASEILGIGYDLFRNQASCIAGQNDLISTLTARIKDSSEKIRQYETANFMTRLKWLFTGTV